MTTPCISNSRLYDIVLFDDTPTAERQQAARQAAALCATCPSQCEQKVTAEDNRPVKACRAPSYGGYLAHKKAGEEACAGCKAKKREYDRERYAKNPRKARAPQRAYEARQRAARKGVAA